ncbi:MAG: AMIN domain-containing protein [Acidobacteria bacterium]|nr:AMIN domain-containing protein [Acidobacteriota bacterium]
MIRVNLLQPIGAREGRVESLIRTGGASSFISRREVLLGLGCLAIAAGALVFQFGGSGDGGRTAAEETPLVSTPPQPLIRDLDADHQAASAATPGAPGRLDTAADVTSAAGADDAAPADANASNVVELEPLATNPTGEVEPSMPAAPPTASSRLAADAPVLHQLVLSSQGETLRIFAATGMQPKYSMFRLDNPKRIVIDLPGVRLTLPTDHHTQTPDHPPVSRIRAGQYRTNPPSARIVLDVTSYPEVEVLPQFNGLYLIVTERPR